MSDNDRKAFDPGQMIDAVKDMVAVRRVYGEAYEREGTLVIPVAKALGCTGLGAGGGDEGNDSGAHGGGGGGVYAVRVRPTGVYVVDATGVHWRPAVDLNRAILVGQLTVGTVLVTALVTGVLRSWRRSVDTRRRPLPVALATRAAGSLWRCGR